MHDMIRISMHRQRYDILNMKQCKKQKAIIPSILNQAGEIGQYPQEMNKVLASTKNDILPNTTQMKQKWSFIKTIKTTNNTKRTGRCSRHALTLDELFTSVGGDALQVTRVT